MKILFAKYFWGYCVLLLLTAGVLWFGWVTLTNHTNASVTDVMVVEQGDIKQSVTVSGRIEAKQIARTGFPVVGTIQQIYKSAGEAVEEGEVIASLTSDSLVAEYNAARERVRFYEEQREALLRGANQEERAVAATKVAVAEAALEKTTREYDKAVSNAWQEMLTNDLRAYPEDKSNNDVPPTLSGNYLCEQEGIYRLDLFQSNAQSNLSYKVSGLATGTYAANIKTPERLGDCGLYIQFDAVERYQNKGWLIEVPNKRSVSYVAYRNAYELLLTQRAAAVAYAEQELAVAKKNEQVVNVEPEPAAVAQADAAIAEAREQLALRAALINDYTIRAPFPGLVSTVDMKVGEVAGAPHTITVVKENSYDLKIRVPEIDITKVKENAVTEVVFDASPSNVYRGRVTFISPVSTDVSGVSYYDAYVSLDVSPEWLREGLNADVTIIVDSVSGVSVLPKRYIMSDDLGAWVLRHTEQGAAKVRVKIGLQGTDNRVEILDLPVGTSVLLPN